MPPEPLSFQPILFSSFPARRKENPVYQEKRTQVQESDGLGFIAIYVTEQLRK